MLLEKNILILVEEKNMIESFVIQPNVKFWKQNRTLRDKKNKYSNSRVALKKISER